MGNFKQSVYLQIVEDVKRKIELGLLESDERLPSCRDFALKIGINPNTVQRAYSELEAEGYIYTVPKKGVYVCARDKKNSVESIAKQKITELKQAGVERSILKRIVDEVYGGD